MVAVIVLFVLLFIGGIFVGLVGRNLINTGRARDTQVAHELARAGIKYCEYFLQHSGEGADWRPAPMTFDIAANPALAQDPDRRWLDPTFIGDQPYSRIDYPNGRALVRVSYQPRFISDPRTGNPMLDPLGKLIKIEAIGRPGLVDVNDPTTFTRIPEPRLRREYVAYKQIGITDYLRYVTNKENDSKAESFLGVPPVAVPTATTVDPLWMQLGKLQVRAHAGVGEALPNTPITTPGAAIRINNSLRLPGNIILSADRRNAEQILVAGDILYDPVTPSQMPPKYYDPETGAQPAENALPPILESSNPAYSSYGGTVRDAQGVPDAQGYARAISALPPPLLSEEDPASRVTRYRMLSRDSGRWIGPAGTQFNTGRFALGSGIYVDNRNARELASRTIAGAQSLRSLWLNPGGQGWNGPHYTPPGSYVEFGYFIVPRRNATDSQLAPNEFVERPGFRITRDVDSGFFRDPTGTTLPQQLVWTLFIYKAPGQRPVLKAENEYYRTYLRTTLNMTERQIDAFLPDFNGVIFMEGNARVRGLVPSLFKREITASGPGDPKLPIRPASDAAGTTIESSDPDSTQITALEVRKSVNPISFTVVSGATVYVEGSIVREQGDPYSDATFPAVPLVTLLAQEYVTVNTTQIMAPIDPRKSFISTAGTTEPPYHLEITTDDRQFAYDFMFGDNPTQYSYTINNQPFNLSLFARHAALETPAYLNLFINEPFPNAAYPFGIPNIPPNVYPLVDAETQVHPNFEQKTLPLLAGAPPVSAGAYQFFTQPGHRNMLRPAVDSSYIEESGTKSYLLSRWAVAPMDVRIEAVMYAENGSFFVIPGYSFNWSRQDTRDAAQALALAENPAATPGTMRRPRGTSDFFPFYGEPFDCRITVVGAVAENRTASVADQSAWMQLWGYIPEGFGSTGHQSGFDPNARTLIPDQHVRIGEVGMPLPNEIRTQAERSAQVTRGIRFLYDPVLHAPYPGYDPNRIGTLLQVGPAGQPRWSHRLGGAHRQDDHGRALPPGARLPLSPGFVFYGEVR